MGRCVRRSVISFAISFSAFGLSACVKVPDLRPIANSSSTDQTKYPGSISINEVVKRIKCEIRDSIAERFGKDYDWFSTWTISTDLSLAVNDNSQIAPGLVLSHQFLLGSIKGAATNVAQSSSLGLGGQVSTTAARTEIVSFSTSVKEIKDEFFDKSGRLRPGSTDGYNECTPYGSVGLTSNLGLKQWVDSALGPVTTTVGPFPGHMLLSKGLHPAAKGPSTGGAKSPSTSGAGNKLMEFIPFKEELQENLQQNQQLKGFLPDLSQAPLADKPERLPDPLKVELEGIIKELSNLQNAEANVTTKKQTIKTLEGKKPPLSEQEAAELKTARGELARLLPDLVNQQKPVLADITAVLPKLEARCDCNSDNYLAPTLQDKWMAYMLKCLKTDQSLLQAAIPKKPTLNPPIDAISHQVQFIIVLDASANPTWTMLNFKGPAPSTGSFSSVTDTNTNTLTIVMGEPSSAAAANARSSLTFGAAISSQIVPPTNAAPVF